MDKCPAKWPLKRTFNKSGNDEGWWTGDQSTKHKAHSKQSKNKTCRGTRCLDPSPPSPYLSGHGPSNPGTSVGECIHLRTKTKKMTKATSKSVKNDPSARFFAFLFLLTGQRKKDNVIALWTFFALLYRASLAPCLFCRLVFFLLLRPTNRHALRLHTQLTALGLGVLGPSLLPSFCHFRPKKFMKS